jgi:hypothetical protein
MDKGPKYKASLQDLHELDDRQSTSEVTSKSLKGLFQSAEDQEDSSSFDDAFVLNTRNSSSNGNEMDQDAINQVIQMSISTLRESQEVIAEITERSKIFNKSQQDNSASVLIRENKRSSIDAFFSSTADEGNEETDDPELTEGLNNMNKMIEYDLKNLLEQSIEQLSGLISSKGLSNQAINPIPQMMLKILKSLISSRSYWLQENWHQINKCLSEIRKMIDSIKLMHAQLPKDDFYHYKYNEMVECVAIESNFHLSNLKTRIYLPALSEELHKGGAEVVNGMISIEKLECQSLTTLLSKLQYENKWYGNELDTLYKRVNVLVRVRRAMISKRWDDVLLCTEKSIETKARRLRRAKFIDLVMKHGGNVFTQKALMSVSDPSIDMATEEFDFPKVIKDNLKNIFKDPEIRVVAEAVENELELSRLESFNRYAQFLLAQATKVGPVLGTHGDVNCEHSFVDPLEVSLAETCLLFLSDGQDLMSTSTEFLRNSVELLAIYRGHAIKSEWTEILAITDKLDQSKSHGNDIISTAMLTINDEIGWIICGARNKFAYNKLLNCLSYGTSSTSVSSTKSSNDAEIEAAVEEAMQCNSGDYAGMSDTLKKLVTFARALLDTRVAVRSSDVQVRQQASLKLNSAVENLAIPEATLAEVSRLNFKLKYEENKNSLQELFDKVAAHLPFVPLNESEKSSEIPRRGDFLHAEGFKLNPNLNIVSLKKVAAETRVFLESLEKIKNHADSLQAFQQLSRLVRACELTIDLRDNMTLLDWKASYDTLIRMETEDLLEIPVISTQHKLYRDKVSVYKALELCLDFFDMPSIVGEIGAFEVSAESITKHASLKELIDSTMLESQLVTDYLRVADIVLSIRKALQDRDFQSLSVTMASNSQLISSGIGAISRNEFTRAKVELDSHNLVEQVCISLQKETVILNNGALETKTEDLSAVIKSIALIGDDNKGLVMSLILNVAEVILKLRRAVMQKEWFMTKSILPIVREELANLKIVVDSKHNNSNKAASVALDKQQRKSVGASFMPTNRRKSAQASSLLANSNMESIIHRIDPRIWTQFQDVHMILHEEINSIDNYFIFQKLEKDISDILGVGAITVEMIGNISSNINLISTVDIENLCLKAATINADASSFAPSLQQLLSVAELIINLRKSVINDEWDILPAMVEEAMLKTKGYLPEISRQELQIVRHELESRWIVTNLTEALQQEKVLGDIDQINLSGVGYLSLLHTLNACKALFPRTSDAIILVNTAEMLIPIRQNLCDQVDWRKINNLTSSILEKPEYISSIVLPEVNLLFNYSELVINCDEMVSSLKNSRLTGEPGILNYSNISIDKLDAVIESADSWTFVTPKMSSLLNACKYIRNLRNIILDYSKNNAGKNLHDMNETFKNSVWTKCKAIITQLLIEKKSSEFSKYGWLYCKDETTLILNHLHLVKIHRDIIDSITSNANAFQSRKQTYNSSATSVKASMWKLNMEVARSCKDLDLLLDYTKAVEFECKALKAYVECIEAIKSMRTALIKDHWDILDAIVRDPNFKSKLEIVPAAVNEYMAIRNDTMNREVVELMTTSIKLPTAIPTLMQGYEHLWDDYDINNLEKTISRADEKFVTSENALNMIAFAKNMLILRKGMTRRSTVEGRVMVQESLESLNKSATDFMSAELIQEINLAQNVLDNDVLVERMKNALSQGRLSGTIGALDTSTIEIGTLGKVLLASKSLKELREDTRDYIKLCETILALRCAVLSDDINGVRHVLDILVTNGNISEFVVEEVALARTEVNTRVLVSSLQKALETFDSDGVSAFHRCADSFWHVLADEKIEWQPIDRIYFEVVSIDELNQAIELGEKLGLFCTLSRKLFRSACIIRDLRKSAIDGDWERIQELLTTIDLSEESVTESYDQRFLPEIKLFLLQVNLRKCFQAIVDNLKYGHAKCHTGIVDTSVMSLEPLETAISSFNKCMEQLAVPSKRQLTGPAQRVMKIFVQSAIVIKSIRKHLFQGEPEIGAYVAHDTLLSGKYHQLIEKELVSYSVNIHKVLYRLSRCIHIQSSLASSNMQELMEISMSKDFGVTKDGNEVTSGDNESINYLDLGFTSLVHCVHKRLTEYNLCSAALQSSSITTSSDASLIKFYLEKSIKFKVPESVSLLSQKRLDQVQRFEAFVDSLNKANENVFYDSNCCNLILDKAKAHAIGDHPHVKNVLFFQSLKPSAQLIAAIARGLKLKSMHLVVHETVKFRRNFFKDDQHVKKYKLNNFKNLRTPSDFLSRTSMTPADTLAIGILAYSDSGIPTSLTKLPPKLATLAVWVFNHCVKAVELQNNMHPELILLNIVRLGRACTALRDELLLQTLKQIESNPNPSSTEKMWRLLGLCLHYFPPSLAFESHLELTLIEIANKGLAVYSEVANYCIVLLHQGVFKYGYDNVLPTALSSDVLKHWLEDNIEDLVKGACGMRIPALGDGIGNNSLKGLWRGTRSDWIDRFKLCASSSVKIKQYAMVKSEFVSITNNKNLDRIDRNVLLYLIEKRIPDTLVQIRRELRGNQESFIPSSADELLSSTKRIHWLQKNVHHYLKVMNTMCSFEEKCSNFWDNIIEKMADECKAFPFLGRLSIVSDSFTSINWEVYREVILVGMQEIADATSK